MSVKDTYLMPGFTELPDRFPQFQTKIFDSFSIDGDNRFVHDTSSCQYVYRNHLSSESVNFNLDDGVDDIILKTEISQLEKIDYLLKYMLLNRNCPDADFVCSRGLLRKLMCKPYEHNDSMIILATKFKGKIYLCTHESEQNARERQRRTEKESSNLRRILSYGLKFEHYMLTDDPSVEPSTDQPFNERADFQCMFQSTLNGQSIMYCAEMDGIVSDESLDLETCDLNECDFVELKLKSLLWGQNDQFIHKLRHWWSQCFLVKIKKIIVGIRDGNVVSNLSQLDVADIPKRAQHHWIPHICMQFCSDFLQMVQRELQRVNNPYSVYCFEYDPSKSLSFFMKTYTRKSELSFLPEWFIKEMK